MKIASRWILLGICVVGIIFVGYVATKDAEAEVAAEDAAPRAQTGVSDAQLPRLVLQITVDQLRGDLPWRHLGQLGDGGFRYLMDHGTWYADAHHAHANTETVVGHATLATGAHPAVHGMVGNLWLDRQTGEQVYNLEDDRYRLLTAGAGVDSETEIDPTQRAARSEGRSPAPIMVSTFSDQLAIHTAGRAKIFGVSIKDRGSITMAGHAGIAYWFSKATGEFVTSTYYMEEYPEWVKAWNKRRLVDRYAGTSWELLGEASTYLFADADDREWETDVAGFGRVFPHPYGPADGRAYTTLLTLSPAGDELTLEFAKALIESEQIGQDEVPDYLSISFSSTDYVGHVFGPSSLEAEDNLRRLDGQLAQLFAFVDEHVGLERTLIVLSADHGGPEAPGYLQQLGIPAQYVDPESWDTQPSIEAIKRRFGVDRELITRYSHPYLYLDTELIQARNLDQVEVEQAIAAELVKLPGVEYALSSSVLRAGAAPETTLNRQILNNFNPTRSGDIYIVFEPGWFLNDFDGMTVTATHGQPWAYDTFVPLAFAGAHVPSARVYRRVHTVDLATTLAAYMRTAPPSGAAGQVLVEVMLGRDGTREEDAEASTPARQGSPSGSSCQVSP